LSPLGRPTQTLPQHSQHHEALLLLLLLLMVRQL
jgi:hypothetical protein